MNKKILSFLTHMGYKLAADSVTRYSYYKNVSEITVYCHLNKREDDIWELQITYPIMSGCYVNTEAFLFDRNKFISLEGKIIAIGLACDIL